MTFEILYSQAKSVINPRELSKFADSGGVGAALLAENGDIFTGVCIDTACSMGFCAEHAAAASMVTQGENKVLKMIAVDWDGTIIPPCGRCREFISQLHEDNLETVVMIRENVTAKMKKLLPYDWRR